MPLFIYILKMLLCSALLTGYYYFFLRNRSFHVYNRYFLLTSFLLTLVLPLLKLPFVSVRDTIRFPDLNNVSSAMLPEVVVSFSRHAERNGSNWPGLLLIAYLFVVIISLVQLLRSVIYLQRLKHKYPYTRFSEAKLFFTTEPDTPFSFFRCIYWNSDRDTSSIASQQVLQHELYHVRQNHTLDILFAESLLVVFWFNPFFHLIKKELKTIHEFLADKAAATASQQQAYAELLLLHAISEKKHPLAQPFFQNEIKRRIAMLTTNHTSSFAYLRRVMCLPLFFILCIACSRNVDQVSLKIKGKKTTNRSDEATKNPSIKDTIRIAGSEFEKLFLDHSSTTNIEMSNTDDLLYISFDHSPVYVIPMKELKAYREAHKKDKETNDLEEVRSANRKEIFTKAADEPSFPGGQAAWAKFLNKTFRYPDEAVEKEIQGTVMLSFIVDKDGSVSNVTALSGDPVLKAEAIRVIKESGKWIPAEVNGRKVKAYRKQPITFRLQSE